jgi:putative tricarboxylic transport membrane protein
VAPIVLGLVLSPALETALRQSLAMSSGSYAIFFGRPIAAVMLAVAGLLLLLSFAPALLRTSGWRQKVGLES